MVSKFKDSVGGTLLIAFIICLVCSVFVAGAAVALKPKQVENRLLDKQRSILSIAGLLTPEMDSAAIRQVYAERITAKLVDLRTGTFSTDFDVERFEPLAAAKDPALSQALGDKDLASIGRRENYTLVYVIEEAGQIKTLILPVRGYGLWSTLHGFLALEGDLNTVVGFGFYQHAETPGLGGEVDNPKWTGQWPGKQVFNAQGELAVRIVKGGVDPQSATRVHEVDGLAGATLTANGVDHLLKFWLGEMGFGPFIANLRKGEA